MRQYSLDLRPDSRYGIYVGQTLLATIGDEEAARQILHRLIKKQLLNPTAHQREFEAVATA